MTAPPATESAVEREVLGALARARKGSLGVAAYLAGLRYVEVSDGVSIVEIATNELASEPGTGIALSTVMTAADLGMAAAARSVRGGGNAMPTLQMRADFVDGSVFSLPLRVRSAVRGASGPMVRAEARVEDVSGREVMAVSGGFLPLRGNSGYRAFSTLPWEEMHDAETLRIEDLDPGEREILDRLTGPAGALSADGLWARYVFQRCESEPEGIAVFHMPLGPYLANRSGNLQGGVTAGALAEAARRFSASLSMRHDRLISSSCTFLRAGEPGSESLRVTSSVRFAGRRITVLQTVLESGDTEIAVGEAVLTGRADGAGAGQGGTEAGRAGKKEN